MLASIHFPLADSRAFVEGELGLLSRPAWPALVPDYEFVRFFGAIRKRKLGGVSGWIGEHAVCEANRALRFKDLSKLAPDLNASISVPFKRFYFDGLAVAKFEIGVAVESKGWSISEGRTTQLIYDVLNLPVDVTAIPGGSVNCKLIQANKYLAKLYVAASTKSSHGAKTLTDSWSVRAGPALIFLVVESNEQILMPFRGVVLPIDPRFGFRLSHYLIPYAGKSIPMWMISTTASANLRIARTLRIGLLRLHAEHECLKMVLQNILANKFSIKARSPASDTLQRYLNEAIRRISRLGSESDALADSELAELTRISQDEINSGDRHAILESLRNIEVRRNVFNKVRDYVNQTVYVQEQIMGDNYTVGQAGAVGPQSQAKHLTFEQVWNQNFENMNLEDLANDLEKLRSELLKSATNAQDYSAIGQVASAESAVRAGNGGKALEYLASTGKWALDTATRIGATVAASAITEALGMK